MWANASQLAAQLTIAIGPRQLVRELTQLLPGSCVTCFPLLNGVFNNLIYLTPIMQNKGPLMSHV